MANALMVSGDPGIMNGKIFHYHCKDGYRDFISVRSDLNCKSSLSSKTYHSLSEYQTESTSSMSFELGVSFEASGGAFGFSLDASAKFSMNRDTSGSSSAKALADAKGEIIVSKAMCYTHDVSVGKYSRARFTSDFRKGLEALNRTLALSETEQMREYKKFVLYFGTHFIKKTNMGASLRYQKIYTVKRVTFVLFYHVRNVLTFLLFAG
jgi:hypothetical protein